MNKKRMKFIAGVLTVSTLLETVSPFMSFAALPKVGVDETIYLNLDYYGNVDKANVVKGITFNSFESYTDYGDYGSITNMSTSEELKADGGKVTVTAPEDGSRLYFEGELDPDAVIAPWTFDVTYKLNGTVVRAEDLAGASGLIEMDIDAYPVASASEYMRNNFVLMAAIPVDNTKYTLVDAPDSQTANLGEYSCVVFEALPGKEGHFEIRLGSNSFETVGAVIMMSPATVGDLEDIKDLKELKDKFRDNTNAMFDDMEALMDNVTDMSAQLDLTNKALADLKEGKNKVHSSAGAVFDANDAALQDLRDLSAVMEPLDTSLKTMQWLIYDVNKDLNTLDQDLLDTSSKMKTLSSRLKDLGSSLSGVDALTEAELAAEMADVKTGLDKVNNGIKSGAKAAGNLSAIAGSQAASSAVDGLVTDAGLTDAEYEEEYLPQAVIGALNANIDLMEAGGVSLSDMTADEIRALEPSVTALLFLYDTLKGAGADDLTSDAILLVLNAIGAADTSKITQALIYAGVPDANRNALQTKLEYIINAGSDLDTRIAAASKAADSAEKENAERFIERLAAMKELQNSAKTIAASEAPDGTSVSENLSSLNDSLQSAASGITDAYDGADAEEIIEQIADVSDEIEEISSYAGSVSFQTARFLTSARNLAGDMDELVTTMNNYYGDIQDAVTNTDNVLLQIQKTSDDTAAALQNINDTMRSAEPDFNAAADSGLEAGSLAVDNTGRMIENVKDLKESGADLRKSINDELDEKEAENNFLNMDPNAVKESLTSSKNQEPDSVSIICRTAEISAEDTEAEEILDAEEAEAESSVWQRIANVFIKIWKAIAGLFSE